MFDTIFEASILYCKYQSYIKFLKSHKKQVIHNILCTNSDTYIIYFFLRIVFLTILIIFYLIIRRNQEEEDETLRDAREREEEQE